MRERIDLPNRTVRLLSRYLHTPALLAGSQGNDQTLPNADLFVGWGEQPSFTEFSPSGQTLFDARLPPTGHTYRAYRFPWSSMPAAPPAVAVRSTGNGTATVYARWNGATGVGSWSVLSGASAAGLFPVATAARIGFETAIPITGTEVYLVAQALDAAGQVLGTSPVAHR